MNKDKYGEIIGGYMKRKKYFKNNCQYFKWYNKKRGTITINNIKINKNSLVIEYDLLVQYV